MDEDRKVIAVRIAPDGYVSDILLEHALLQGHWAEKVQWAKENQTILSRPPLCTAADKPTSFVVHRKLSRKSANRADLVVWHWPHKNGLPLNQTASNHFKMQIYGDVVLVRVSKEQSLLPRERFINFSYVDYSETFHGKRNVKRNIRLVGRSMRCPPRSMCRTE